MPKALENITCLELAEGWSAGALTGRLFKELGARVIKIENQEGDELRYDSPIIDGDISYGFQLVNGGKESISLDFSKVESINFIKRIAANVDFLLIDKGFLDKYLKNLNYEGLKQNNEQLICCYTSPFGLTGPLSNYHANDFIVQAMSGVMATTGYSGGDPLKTGPLLAQHVGGIFAASAMLAALEYREKTGQGQLIDISLYDVMVGYLGTYLPAYYLTGTEPERQGNRHTMVSPWNAFSAKDGGVIICAMTDNQWETLVKIIGRKDLIGDGRFQDRRSRTAYNTEIEEIINSWVKDRSKQEVIDVLNEFDVPASPILPINEVIHSELFEYRQLATWTKDSHLGKRLRSGILFKMSETPGVLCGDAPSLGEHNFKIKPDAVV